MTAPQAEKAPALKMWTPERTRSEEVLYALPALERKAVQQTEPVPGTDEAVCVSG